MVYYKLYKETRERAKLAKDEYTRLCLEATTIKEKYNLESDEDSNNNDDSVDSDYESDLEENIDRDSDLENI